MKIFKLALISSILAAAKKMLILNNHQESPLAVNAEKIVVLKDMNAEMTDKIIDTNAEMNAETNKLRMGQVPMPQLQIRKCWAYGTNQHENIRFCNVLLNNERLELKQSCFATSDKHER